MSWRRSLLLPLLALLFAGCAHYPPNVPLARHAPEQGYRFANLVSPPDTDEIFLILTFSGGGTRAAALAYGVLEELAATTWQRNGKTLRLLDEVDIISSVSGGSFAAAYYALHGDRMFDDFLAVFLKRDVQGEITRKMLAPYNLARASSPKFGRIDLVAEYLDAEIYGGSTYGDLVRRGTRPFVMLNASDMSLGTRFEFTQDQFDLLCSDLSAFPVARAVAASSAVPILFSPMTLKNYSGQCDYAGPALPGSQIATTRQTYKAAETRSYLDATARPYIHLLDGGLTDNLGLRGMLDRVAARDDPHELTRALRLGRFDKAVLVIVNAETSPDLALDRREEVPTIVQVFRAIKDIPINRYSFETIELFKANLENWSRQLREQGGEHGHAGFDFYLVEVTFDAIPDVAERDAFRVIPTSLALPAETVDRLRALGPRLMQASEGYQRLLRDLAHGPGNRLLQHDAGWRRRIRPRGNHLDRQGDKQAMAEQHRQRLSAEARQEEIIRAAVDLAGEQGVDGVTTQDMAKAVGITQGAIFRHFPTKDMIWLGVVHWVRGRLMGVLDMAAAQGTDPLDALERMFFAHLGFVEKVPAIPKLIFTNQLLKNNPRIHELVRSILADYENKVCGLIAQARERNLVRPDLDDAAAAVMFTGMIQGLVIRVPIMEARKSLVEEGRLIFPIFLHGIGAVRTPA